jgi:integrase
MPYGYAGVLTKMLTKRVRYTFNRSGYYYFTRRVPTDLQKHYLCPRIVQGLNTKCSSTAKTRALVAAAKLDEYWSHLRMTDPDLIGHHLLKTSLPRQAVKADSGPAQSIPLSEALNTYLTIKGKGKGKTFHTAAERACKYLVEATAHKHLHEYTRQDALAFRDYLKAKGLAGSSISRIYKALNSTLNFTINEYALDISNPFSRVYFDRTDKVKKRLPIPTDILKQIQSECYRIDDDMRWLLALISDTGLRLSEAAGLHREDLVLHHKIPHLIIQAHPWRTLKTSASERKVPLVGASLWAAQRILSDDLNRVFAFPSYNRSEQTNGNSASAALNKWLKSYVPDGCSIHSFRHSMRDRLRVVNCPSEMIDQIGGWSKDTVGQGYGLGFGLETLTGYMDQITI